MVIILFVPFIAGCAALKRSNQTESTVRMKSNVSKKEIIALNLTNNDFNIIKAEVDIITGNEKERFLGTVKYEYEGKYLISIRNRSGIEGARIFITQDTIMVNDRINKTLYYGSTGYLNDKYGITTEMLPVILGDLITGIQEGEVNECRKNKVFINYRLKGKDIGYTIDCNKMKVINTTVYDAITKTNITIEYRNFSRTDEYVIARNISLKTDDKEERIEINIEKLEIGLKNDITFIPGKKYEKILLK